MVVTHRHAVATKGQADAHDITDRVSSAVDASRCEAGIVTVFVVGSTAAITTIEFEPGAVADFNRVLDGLAPRGGAYQHHLRLGRRQRIEQRAPRPLRRSLY